jgi:hypothetical protein
LHRLLTNEIFQQGIGGLSGVMYYTKTLEWQ